MKKKFKIRYKRLLIFLIALALLILLVCKIINIKISNIYVSGNTYLSDQYIIETAQLDNYPHAFQTFSHNLKSKLENDDYIKNAKVTKKKFTIIYIEVEENKPLFYDETTKKTILEDGTKVNEMYDLPILTNEINDEIYEKFLNKFSNINSDILEQISEIEYSPNTVDKELFLFTMKDGNYVSINLNKFSSINRYTDMVKKFNNKKGILYLDSGEYFKILDN